MTHLGILIYSPAKLEYRTNTVSTKKINWVLTPKNLQKMVNHKLGIITVEMFKDVSYFSVLVRFDFHCTFATRLKQFLIKTWLYWE